MPVLTVQLADLQAEGPYTFQIADCRLLVGRDVLQHAVFIYTGYNNTFTLSF